VFKGDNAMLKELGLREKRERNERETRGRMKNKKYDGKIYAHKK